MTVAHGPQWAVIVGHFPDADGTSSIESGAIGVRFVPVVRHLASTPIIKEPDVPYRSMLNGEPVGPGTDHPLGERGSLGYGFSVENSIYKGAEYSFVSGADANGTHEAMQLNGLNIIHEPGYEMVLAALRKICEAPA